MNEDTNPESEPVKPAEQAPTYEHVPEPVDLPSAAPAAGSPASAPRFRDRVLGMKAVAGVALASVVLGGAGGAALGALSDGQDGDRDGNRFGGPMMMNGTGNQMMPNGQNGQMLPPGTQGQLPPGLDPDADSDSGSDSGTSG